MESADGFLKSASRPFAMHLWNVLPRIGHNNDEIRAGKCYAERMRRSFEYLDVMVKRLMGRLASS